MYSTDGQPLEAVVGQLLREHHMTIAVAESCTGGLLASRITDVPGSSKYFMGGAVCYTSETKIALAGVAPQLLDAVGPVAAPTARALAVGARQRCAATTSSYGSATQSSAGRCLPQLARR